MAIPNEYLVANIPTLRTLASGNNTLKYLSSTNTWVRYASADTQVDNGVTVFKPTAVSGAGRWVVQQTARFGRSTTKVNSTTQLTPQAYEFTHGLIGKVFILLSVATNTPARVRLYSREDYQASDQPRPIGAIAPAGSGPIVDIVTTSNELKIRLAPMPTGANLEDDVISLIPVTIQNLTNSTATIVATIEFIILEP
jgi:hypothetical protein